MEFNKKEEIENLRLCILPCSENVPKKVEKEYEAAYDLWHKVWSKTLFNLDGVKNLHSNEFSRHDFCSVILRGEEAVGLFCYSTVNLSLRVRKEDSWFSAWPKELLEEIGKSCTFGLMPAWLAVHPDYRRSKSNYPINLAQVVMEIYAKLLLEYKYEMGFGTTRNERGVNKLIENTGGDKLQSAQDHGVDVDLIAMRPSNIRFKEKQFSETFHSLWERREDLWMRNYEQRIQLPA